jgi:preprotein translocase subunit SecG
MGILKIVLTILFAIDCIVLTTLVLVQEGKSSGLGTLSGGNDTFWGQNKGRSMEGKLVIATRIAAILFLVLAVALNLGVFNA